MSTPPVTGSHRLAASCDGSRSLPHLPSRGHVNALPAWPFSQSCMEPRTLDGAAVVEFLQRRGMRMPIKPPRRRKFARDRRHEKRVTDYRSELPETGETREVEYAAVGEALHFACRDLREGRRRPLEITENGIVVHDAGEIARLCEERREEEDLERRLTGES